MDILGTATSLAGTDIETAFTSQLTPKARSVYNTVLPDTGALNSFFIGVTVKGCEDRLSALATAFENAVADGVVTDGMLTQLMRIPLATIDNEKRYLLVLYPMTGLDPKEAKEATRFAKV